MQDKIAKAQKDIGEILATLERETGTIVTDIAIHDVDTTRLQDEVKQITRRVVVSVERIPGTNWG
jgi:hypothetical protein